MTIKTRQSLPTWLLGAHTLQLRMTEPNQLASRPIEIVVSAGKWKMEQLIQPESGAVFDVNEAPHLLWAIVPGAMKYQVGFSSKPYFSRYRQMVRCGGESVAGAGSGVAKPAGGRAVLDGAHGGCLERAAQTPCPCAFCIAGGVVQRICRFPMGAPQERGRAMRVNSQLYPRESRRANDSPEGKLSARGLSDCGVCR